MYHLRESVAQKKPRRKGVKNIVRMYVRLSLAVRAGLWYDRQVTIDEKLDLTLLGMEE